MRETGAQDGKLFLAFLQPLQLLLAPQSFRTAYGQPAVLLELPRLPERLGPTADPQEPGRLPCNRPQRRTLLLVRLILSSVALAVGCSGHSATSQADAPPRFGVSLHLRGDHCCPVAPSPEQTWRP